MNALETAIEAAFVQQGQLKEANKAYLEFIKANFIIPIEKRNRDDEEPRVLFNQEGDTTFLPVFTSMDYLTPWASDIADGIDLLKLSGVDLLKNTGENVTVCLNIGSPWYKEFNPNELARMRSMVIKFF